ncbi:hypothetical protein ACFL20_03605 [Spirochaetota bacterium]
MKRTDYERHQRELKKSAKKSEILERKGRTGGTSKVIGSYIKDLFSLLRYDDEKIYNTQNDMGILELLEEMKGDLPREQWENVLRKSIKKTKVSQKDEAFKDLSELMGD